MITGGNLDISADSSAEIFAVGLSGAGVSGSFALAGSVVFNVISNTTQAVVSNFSDLTVTEDAGGVAGETGNVSLNAQDTASIVAIAGAGAVASGFSTNTQTGIGAAIVVNIIANSEGTVAEITDSDVTADGSVIVSAMSDVQIDSVTAAVAAAGGIFGMGKATAIPISVGVNIVSTTTQASVERKKATGIVGKRGVSIYADDNTDVVSIAGTAGISVAASGSDTAGAAISVNVVNNRVVALARDTSVRADAGNVTVTSDSTPTITSVAAGAAVAGGTALQGSFSINVLDNETIAAIDGTSDVFALGSVLVSADDRLDLVTVGGSIAIGGFTGGNSVGIANSTMVTDNLVEATLGDGVTVQANADTSIPVLTVRTGEIDDSFNKLTESARGVIVTAVSLDEVISVAIGGSVAGTSGNAIAGSATVTSLNEDTRATIGVGDLINQATTGESTAQSVIVRAGERTELSGVAGAVGISWGGAGVGAGADIAVINKDVTASIGRAADVDARNNVMVEAFSFEDSLSIAASAGIGTSEGVAGALGVSVYDIDTQAYIQGEETANSIEGATVFAEGSVLVSAEERTEIELGTGTYALGGSNGLGGAIDVPIILKNTKATIGNGATVDALANRSAITVNSGDFLTFGDGTAQNGEIEAIDLDNSDLPTDNDDSYFSDRNANPDTITGFKGVAVTATNSDQVELFETVAKKSGMCYPARA